MRLLSAFLLVCLFVFILSPSSYTFANEDEVDGDVDISEDQAASHSSSSSASSANDVDVDMSDDDDLGGINTGAPSSAYHQQQYTLETLPSSGDISTTVYFPPADATHLTKDVNGEIEAYKFIVGEEVSILLGVQNTGIRPYNLTYITGSLHSPYDHTYYIQNFTVNLISAVVDAGTEISIEYKFKTDPNLEPLQFQLQAYFLYNTTDDREVYRVTFFNKTVDLVEKSGDFNIRTIFSYLLVLSALGIGGYYVYDSRMSKTVLRRSRSSFDSNNANANRVQQEWTAPIYTPSDKSKPVKKRSKKN